MDKSLRYLNFYTKYSSEGTTTIDSLERSSVCFGDVFRGPKQLNNTYIIYVYKGEDKLLYDHDNNGCFLSKSEVVRYIKLLHKLLPCKFKSLVREDDEKYIIKIKLKGSNLCHRFLLSFIRYLYEFPYCVYIRDAIKLNRMKEYRFVSIFNLFNLVRCSIPNYDHGGNIHAIGCNTGIYRKVKTREIRELLHQNKYSELNHMMSEYSLNDKIEINTFKEDLDNTITKDLNFWESEEEFNKRLELYNTNYKLINSKK